MNVDTSVRLQGYGPGAAERSPSGDRNGSFSSCLETALDQTQEAEAGCPVPTPIRLYDQGCRMLETLDRYQAQLADPRVRLQEMAPFVAHMEGLTKGLSRTLEASPSYDGLKDILQEVLSLASETLAGFPEAGAYSGGLLCASEGRSL